MKRQPTNERKHLQIICLFSLVQSLSRVQLFVTPWTTARQTSLSITDSWSSPQLMSIKSVMPSNHLILCCPLLLLPSIFPSIRVFSNESALCIRWPKYWSFSFNISPSNEHPGLTSFRMDWLDLLTVQRTLKSLLQHHSSKASILWCSTFFIVQLSHLFVRRLILKYLRDLYNSRTKTKTSQSKNGQKYWVDFFFFSKDYIKIANKYM